MTDSHMHMLPSDTLCIVYSFLRIKQIIYSCTRVNQHWRSTSELYFESRLSQLDVAREALVRVGDAEFQRKVPTKQKRRKEAAPTTKKKKQGSASKKGRAADSKYKLTTEEQDHELYQLKSLMHYLLHLRRIRSVDYFILQSDYVTRENCLNWFPDSFWSRIKHVQIGPCKKLCQRKWFTFLNDCSSGLESLDMTIPSMQDHIMTMSVLSGLILKHKNFLKCLALRGRATRMAIDTNFMEKCIARCVHLTSLTIENAGDCSTRSLVHLTRQCKNLEHLCLREYDGSLSPLVDLEHLRRIELDDCHISSVCLLEQLRELVMRSCFIHVDRTGGEVCMDDSEDDGEMITDFEIVDASGFNIGRLTELRVLEVLDAKNCNYDCFFLSEALEFEYQIQSLKNLERLTIGNVVDSSVLHELRSCSSTLKHLTLIRCQFDVESMQNVFQSMASHLTSLVLEDCQHSTIQVLPTVFEVLTGLTALKIIDSNVCLTHVQKAVNQMTKSDHPLKKIVLLTNEHHISIKLLRDLKSSHLHRLRIVKLSCDDHYNEGPHHTAEYEIIKRTKRTITYCLTK